MQKNELKWAMIRTFSVISDLDEVILVKALCSCKILINSALRRFFGLLMALKLANMVADVGWIRISLKMKNMAFLRLEIFTF